MISKGETQQIEISRIFVQPLIIMIASGASLLTQINGVDTGYWVLVTGYWLLVAGIWLLGTGFWILVNGYR
jgi:hypothetical protein